MVNGPALSTLGDFHVGARSRPAAPTRLFSDSQCLGLTLDIKSFTGDVCIFSSGNSEHTDWIAKTLRRLYTCMVMRSTKAYKELG